MGALPAQVGRDTKFCARCERQFARGRHDSATQWKQRRYCSLACSSGMRRVANHHVGPHAVVLPDDTWQQHATCRGSAHRGADLWFSDDKNDRARARKLCRTACPVRAECLRWAVTTQQMFGVWGGMGEDERAQLEPEGASA